MFTLAEALNQGIPLDRVYNAPSKFTIPGAGDNGGDYVVGNYADAGLGRLDLVQSTAKSSNTAYVQIIRDVGPENVVALAHRMGITSELAPYLSLTLGASDVSVYDMASAYSTLADGGEHRSPFVVSKVTDAAGNVLYEHRVVGDRVLQPEVAEGVNYALSQVVETGTGKAAKIDQPVAGKTGTTDDYRDAWFVGFTCKLTTAVWMGYPLADANGQPRYMENVHGTRVTGGSFPTQIWKKYMDVATDGLESCPFPKPGEDPNATTSTTVRSVTNRPSAPATQAPATTAPPAPTTTAPPATTTTTTSGGSTTTLASGEDEGGASPP
jgi:membrane peptidoglycan carboxypeptidase